MQVYDNFNPQLLKALPSGLENVLELGCDTGRLGEAYKTRNPGTLWTGFDINPEAVGLAKTRLNVAEVCTSSARIEHSTLRRQQFDALVYGDVLEHLVDPWGVLSQHAQYLRPGGLLVVSIPNIHHWSIVKRLITGDWQYASKGILDSTHLRFFGKASLLKMIEGAGFEVASIKPLIFKENDDAFIEGLQSVAASLDLPFCREELLAFQYLVTGLKRQAPKLDRS